MPEVNPIAWRLGARNPGIGDCDYTYTEYDTTVEYWEKNLVKIFGPIEPLYSQETVNDLQNQITSLARTGRGMMVTVNDALARAAIAEEEIARLREALRFYAEEISYVPTQMREPRTAVHGDNGRRARDALGKQ